ncbi:hypothetical protein acsn021_02920 [Anaerocolumna cellulosilytica]|uniref:Uncharacterized protein n=1 Tax=Anaerocolumna cellulosilytica TaxID=433286 RepID=A0A6S6QMZ7_9FIRM|nr:helix-turn-helix transcriptional regulator [Anaerocolumna cellulosilytica]MBB5196876.1 transcriptional regulator with XRE-family HTH domain [Anaerocolumna cellulosilytica]BCJ92723.1 hypothetical protein acsn021_02920 [Anaerocolumna cellulosilytica]
MDYEHFGILLQDLRLKHNMSREKLAENICTPKQIYRIEKGKSEPSVYLLHQLSMIFNIDLNEYYKMYFKNYTITGLEGIKAINSALKAENIPLLKSIILQYETLEEFQNGDLLQHIYYGKALCSALLNKDYKTSLDYCLKGIRLECPEFVLDDITERTYSNVGITLLICISNNYFAMNHYTSGMNVLHGLLIVLETHFLNSAYPIYDSSEFISNALQFVLSNISGYSFQHGGIEKSLIHTEKGIDYAIEKQNFRRLPSLLSLKCKILYRMQLIHEAKEYYEHAVHLYQIAGNENSLTEFIEEITSDYPVILGI